MITISVEESKPVTQEDYDRLTDSIEPRTLTCPCGRSGSLVRYGSYCRHVKTGGSRIRLIISRTLCSECGHSHALIPSSLVPYSQIPLKDQVSAIESHEKGENPAAMLEDNPDVDDRTPFRLIKIYLAYWRERLISMHIRLRPLGVLVRECLSHFGRQFMQIKNTPNIFFALPT